MFLETIFKILNKLYCYFASILSWLNPYEYLKSVPFKERIKSINRPNFIDTTLDAALETCSKEKKLLFVYFHLFEKDESASFLENVLCQRNVCQVLEEFCVWGADLSHWSVQSIARRFRCNSSPFICLIGFKNGKQSPLLVIEGKTTSEGLVSHLRSVLNEHEEEMKRMNELERLKEQERNLIYEQDSAYIQSLQIDQEKERRKKLEEEQIQAKHQKRLQKKLKLKEKFSVLRNRIVPEPTSGNLCRLQVKMPDGKINRNFRPENTIKNVYEFVSTLEYFQENVCEFSIYSNFPKRLLEESDLTLAESGLMPSASLFVEIEESEEE